MSPTINCPSAVGSWADERQADRSVVAVILGFLSTFITPSDDDHGARRKFGTCVCDVRKADRSKPAQTPRVEADRLQLI